MMYHDCIATQRRTNDPRINSTSAKLIQSEAKHKEEGRSRSRSSKNIGSGILSGFYGGTEKHSNQRASSLRNIERVRVRNIPKHSVPMEKTSNERISKMTSEFNEVLSQSEEIIELRRALKTAQLATARAQRKTADNIEAVYRAAKDASLATGKPPKFPIYKMTKGKNPEVALVHATDWQLGKRTADYGVTTCRTRIDQLVTKVLSLTEIQRSHHPVNECVVMFGGDMVEGVGIFPGQAYEIEAHLFTQLFEVAGIMESMLQRLSAHFTKVHVVCEFGNHGRLGRKGDMPSGDNIDRMAYQITSERTKDLKNVTWQMSNDWYQIVVVGNYRALLVHGDEINSFGGSTPAFGILRKCNAWSTGVVEPFQDVYMGHWHTPMTLTMANAGRIFVTGSTESHSEYARAFIAAVGKPSQRLHFIDPDKGRVTAEYTCWLD